MTHPGKTTMREMRNVYGYQASPARPACGWCANGVRGANGHGVRCTRHGMDVRKYGVCALFGWRDGEEPKQ